MSTSGSPAVTELGNHTNDSYSFWNARSMPGASMHSGLLGFSCSYEVGRYCCTAENPGLERSACSESRNYCGGLAGVGT